MTTAKTTTPQTTTRRLCEGRVCVITGAGRGIGREYALMLAANGAIVVVNDLGAGVDGRGSSDKPALEVVDEIRSAGGEACANGEDISDWSGARRLIAAAVDAYGGIDVLVNNAGVLRDRMLVNMSEEEWDAVIGVHLKGTVATTRWAAAYWRDQSKAGKNCQARIINTTSASGIYGKIGQGNYGAAKAGIASLTVIAAKELGRYGVTVNAVAPLAFTRMTDGLKELTVEQRAARSPHWLAPIVTWLASLESSHITGRVFEASGDMLAVAEGWHRGPRVGPVDDPVGLGSLVNGLVAKARPNATMQGEDETS
jgi:NAD(P)-dependent dehydrogenase (short-subunit alcohol dehydrogenase family)